MLSNLGIIYTGFFYPILAKQSFYDLRYHSYCYCNTIMRPQPSFEKIAINTIEISDRWNIHPFLSSQSCPKTRASIKTFGLLHPPLVHKLSTNQYQLISGHNRLSIFREIFVDEETITVVVLEENTNAKTILSYILEKQLLSGSISPMEKACFFHTVLNEMSLDEAAVIFSPILGQSLQPHSIKKILLLLNLEPKLKVDVHNGIVGERMAFELLQLCPEDRLTIHKLIQILELGGGKQKRILTLCKDLARSQNNTIKKLLEKAEFQDILNHPEMNRPQKTSNLISILHKKLFPMSNAAEEQFLRTVNRMNLPASCSVSHSQSFEKNEVSVIMKFKNLIEVEQKLSVIKQLLER